MKMAAMHLFPLMLIPPPKSPSLKSKSKQKLNGSTPAPAKKWITNLRNLDRKAGNKTELKTNFNRRSNCYNKEINYQAST